METLKLYFETAFDGKKENIIIEVPYDDGMVATSEFCPTHLLEGGVRLIAALRGDFLESFISNCRMQLAASSKIDKAESELDRHIGGLIAVVMDKMAANSPLPYSVLLNCIDCFSLILKARGVETEEIKKIYPHVLETIINLYPDYIEDISA
ncbi:MAG: hypothetical protein K2H46_07440 [Muribaculaceae bacterium]|nr:hypothetical protein [Muribaculaceae bacterium]